MFSNIKKVKLAVVLSKTIQNLENPPLFHFIQLPICFMTNTCVFVDKVKGPQLTFTIMSLEQAHSSFQPLKQPRKIYIWGRNRDDD